MAGGSAATFQFGGIKVGQQFNLKSARIPKYLTDNPNTYYVPTQFKQMANVNPQTMIQVFKEELNFGAYTEYVARMVLRKFAQVAARFSPPNIGKAIIDRKYYYRPYYKIEDLINGDVRTERGRRLHATKEDFAALRAGFKYKVMNTKHGVKPGTVYAYTKGINQAKRVSRIQNRGLTKYSWGSILNTFNSQNVAKTFRRQSRGTRFGVMNQAGTAQFKNRILVQTDLPVMFKRLQNKSPNIAKYRWGSVRWEEAKEGNTIKLTIQNNLAAVERYCDIAIRQGLNAASKEVYKLINYIQSDAKEKIEKMFNFKLFRVTRVTALNYSTKAQRQANIPEQYRK